MRVHGFIFSVLAAATMIGPAGAAPAKSSAIIAVDVTRELPAGTYGGWAWRYLEGVIRGEVSGAEPVAGLSELAAGRATVPYEVAFHIVAPESSLGGRLRCRRGAQSRQSHSRPLAWRSRRDGAWSGCRRRGGGCGRRRLSAQALDFARRGSMAGGSSRRPARGRAGDRRDRRPGFRPLARRRLSRRLRVRARAGLPPPRPRGREPERVVREHISRRRLQRRSGDRPGRLRGGVHPQRQWRRARDQQLRRWAAGSSPTRETISRR